MNSQGASFGMVYVDQSISIYAGGQAWSCIQLT